MKLIARLSGIAVFLLALAPATGLAEETATLVPTSDEDRRNLRYATPYGVELTLRQPLTVAQMEDVETFRVVDARTGASVDVSRVTEGGSRKNEEPAVPRYSKAALWGSFQAIRHTDKRDLTPYVVLIRYPDAAENEVRVPVTIAEDTPDSDASILARAADLGSFNFEPMLSDEANGLGFKYDLEYQMNHFFGVVRSRPVRAGDADATPRILDIKLTSNGELSTNVDGTDFRTNLFFTLLADYRWHPRFNLTVPQSDGTSVERRYAYPMGFQLRVADFECDQSFDVVNYTAKLQAVAAVPFSDAPVFWWHAKTGVNRHFVPLVVAAGYTVVAKLDDETPPGRRLTETHRFDFEALYNIPVSSRIDAGVHWKGALEPSGGEFVNVVDVGATVYLSKNRRSGIRVSYVKGGEAPTFEDTESVRVGFLLEVL